MSDMLGQISALNKAIDTLMQRRTKTEAQRELLDQRLKEGMEEYKKKYGVDLSGEGFESIKKNITQEVTTVKTSVEEEYKLASQVVSCINEGRYAEAYELLGQPLETKKDVAPEPEEKEQKKQQKTPPKSQSDEGLMGVLDIMDELPDEDTGAEDDANGFEDSSLSADAFAGFGVEDDTDDLEDRGSDELDNFDEDDDFGFGEMLNNGKF